jgi:hypothetical protein
MENNNQENSTSKKLPREITEQQLKKLIEHLNSTFECIGKNDEVDWDKVIRQMATSVGHWYINYQGILMSERMKLSELEDILRLKRAHAFHELKTSKIKYDVDVKNMQILIEGSEMYRSSKLDYDKQKAYIMFLEASVDHIKYYSNNIKNMLAVREFKERYGY